MNSIQINASEKRETLELDIRARDTQPELVHPADILPLEETERAKRAA
jgi:hypothetical protein